MKTAIIILLLVQFLFVASCATPSLVSNEYTSPPPKNGCLPDIFMVQFDNDIAKGRWKPIPAQVMPNTGNTRLHYDLSELPAGPHTVRAKAKCSQQELESDPSAPLSFTKQISPRGRCLKSDSGKGDVCGKGDVRAEIALFKASSGFRQARSARTVPKP